MPFARKAADDLGGKTTSLAFDLSEPTGVKAALEGLGTVDRLVLAGVQRDVNTLREYDIEAAIALVTLKLVGYVAVIHALVERLHDDSSILVFGGLAKERPYPSGMTVTTINAGVDGLVRALTHELTPIRVNALHPGIVELPVLGRQDRGARSPSCSNDDGETGPDGRRRRGGVHAGEPLGRRNRALVDGGWSLPK